MKNSTKIILVFDLDRLDKDIVNKKDLFLYIFFILNYKNSLLDYSKNKFIFNIERVNAVQIIFS